MHGAGQLGEAAHAANDGVIGGGQDVGGQAVHHGMAMIGAEAEPPVGTVFAATAILFVDKNAEKGWPVDIAREVLGFIETPDD